MAGSWAVDTQADVDETPTGRDGATDTGEPGPSRRLPAPAPRGPSNPPPAPPPPPPPPSASASASASAASSSSRVVSARRAFALVTLSLAAMAVLRAPAAVHAGEGMPAGTTRDVVLALARPLATVTHPLGLDWPSRRLSAFFGHGAPATHSELVTAAGQEKSAATTAEPRMGGKGLVTPPPPAPAPVRVPTTADPLRVLVTGDSLTESLGPTIANTGPATVRAQTDTRFGTGLVRPDFFDWASHAREQIAARDPEVVVVALGANDGQGITLPDGTVLPAGSPRWADEYRRRALVLLRIWTDGGQRRVYWASLPPARSGRLDGYFRQLNAAVADAARQVPGAEFLDLTPELTDQGHYSDYLRNPAGHTVLARTRDGVHYTLDGSRIVAVPILAALTADYRLSTPVPAGAG
ncbi:SGNH/GDSL hydrolase family protein [Pseudofrankia sp. EUN1h]|uniref:SGNH/GDSL hydrolase family protein n=1 Tax=Pseudofrankia sp. EUN1h TaxID=1834515 RepID=UPI001F518EE0|nr:DUF459 domain-containing protein [Pseudofrankia sp. EUN1h]